MKIQKISTLEDCFEESVTREIVLDEIVSKDFIMFWKDHGELEYYESFARPFFKVSKKNSFIVKGIEGSNKLRLILSKPSPEKNLKKFQDILALFNS
jgi:hypothetical protein